MHLCLQIYLIPIPQTLIQGEKQTNPETNHGSIKHNNCEGQYSLLIRVCMPNIQLDIYIHYFIYYSYRQYEFHIIIPISQGRKLNLER